MLHGPSIWVSWKEKRQRWEVGFWWEGKPYTFYSWVIQGKRYSFTRDMKPIAEQFKSYIRGKMQPNEDGFCTFEPGQIKTGRRKSLYTFSKWVDMWLMEYALKIETGDISREYVAHLNRYSRLYWVPALGCLDIREIKKPVIKKFYLDLCKKTYSKKHIQNIMDALKKLLNDASEDIDGLHMPKFPDYKIKPKSRERGHWLKEHEQDRVIAHVPDIHKPIVMTRMYHGLRESEVRDLRIKQLIKIKGRLAIDVHTRKGGPDRVIVLEPDLADLIQAIPRPLKHDYLYHWHGQPYAKTTLWKIIRKALDEAGFKHITPNDACRHSHASQLWRRGASAPEVQYIMGHSDIRTTMIYSHIDPADQERYARRNSLHPVDTVRMTETTRDGT